MTKIDYHYDVTDKIFFIFILLYVLRSVSVALVSVVVKWRPTHVHQAHFMDALPPDNRNHESNF